MFLFVLDGIEEREGERGLNRVHIFWVVLVSRECLMTVVKCVEKGGEQDKPAQRFDHSWGRMLYVNCSCIVILRVVHCRSQRRCWPFNVVI